MFMITSFVNKQTNAKADFTKSETKRARREQTNKHAVFVHVRRTEKLSENQTLVKTNGTAGRKTKVGGARERCGRTGGDVTRTGRGAHELGSARRCGGRIRGGLGRGLHGHGRGRGRGGRIGVDVIRWLHALWCEGAVGWLRMGAWFCAHHVSYHA